MFEPNVTRLLDELRPDDLVLDVGGWACPFNRANWIIDSEPYDSRGYYRTFGGKPSQGGEVEHFDGSTWVQRDICEKTPFPFADKHFDFVICSHTLEDLRDPLWVCSELIRVGKRGYIEVPSRAIESTRDVERPGQAGLSHHRWLVDIEEGRVSFLQKYHMIHSHWRFSLPGSFAQTLPSARHNQWLWWEGSFEFEEVTIHGIEEQERELERFVQTTRPYPDWWLGLDRRYRTAESLGRRAVRKAARWFNSTTRR